MFVYVYHLYTYNNNTITIPCILFYTLYSMTIGKLREESLGEEKYTFIEESRQGKSCTLLIRGMRGGVYRCIAVYVSVGVY